MVNEELKKFLDDLAGRESLDGEDVYKLLKQLAPVYLTEKEVSVMTKRGLQTLRNERFNSRGIAYVKLERSVRYNLLDVIQYMESRKIIPAEAV
jgi:hypothetical protein